MELCIDRIPHPLESKLQNLVSFLVRLTKGFDGIAEEIDNTNLKTAMITFASESKQYAKEICSYFEERGLQIPSVCTNHLWERVEMTINEEAGAEKGGEILTLCNNCEHHFKRLYQDVLEEYFPYSKLKSMIKYQLFAAKCAFMKIRLLNSLRFN